MGAGRLGMALAGLLALAVLSVALAAVTHAAKPKAKRGKKRPAKVDGGVVPPEHDEAARARYEAGVASQLDVELRPAKFHEHVPGRDRISVANSDLLHDAVGWRE